MKPAFAFKIIFPLSFFITYHTLPNDAGFDLTVVGPIAFADGIGRQSIEIIDSLHKELTINFVHSRMSYPVLFTQESLQDIPPHIHSILKEQTPGFSNVTLFEDVLTYNGHDFYKKIPHDTLIKIAYTMFEGTAIPATWVTILNTYFDAAVVPDHYLKIVYSQCGVKIPIFVLPLGVYLEPFLQKKIKKSSNKPFVFGVSAAFSYRKNHTLLLKSFAQEFGNNPNVLLKIHGRYAQPDIYNEVIALIQELNLLNIVLIDTSLSWDEYVEFIASLDCYVLLSKAEGFSITPREALACGVPCILSNNTAHTTICNTGFVLSVPSLIPESILTAQSIPGYIFNCDNSDVRKALREMYNNYTVYKKKAEDARSWVSFYQHTTLKPFYLSLIKPKKVILGDENRIEQDYLITNCKKLYEKYMIFSH